VRRVGSWASLAPLLAIAGCFQALNDGPATSTCSTCRSGGTSGGHRGAGGSGGGTGGGPADGGDDGGVPDGSDGGSDAGADGGADAGLDGGSDAGGTSCPAGSVRLTGVVFDMCATIQSESDVPLAGVQVATLAPWGATTSAADGTFTLCVPSGTPFTVETTLSGYTTGYLGEAVLTQDESFEGAHVGLQMMCSAGLLAIQAQLSDFDPSEGVVIVGVRSSSKTGTCGSETGWYVTAAPSDGGAAVGNVVYITPAGQAATDGGTSSTGLGLVYDIPPADVSEVVVAATNPLVGASCPDYDSTLGFTGAVRIAPNTVGSLPWVIP
jgi:hypothetical protein